MKKKILPVLIVICLIVIISAVGITTSIIKKYTPSDERMESREYFQLEASDQAALVVNRVVTEEKIKIIDGRYYVEDIIVGKYINSRFYWDEQQEVMLYTLPTEIIQILPETKSYETANGTVQTEYVILKAVEDAFYLDLEFIQQYSQIDCNIYEDPARIVIRTEWNEEQVVTASSDSVIRQKGGIKSIIVDEIEEGEKLYLDETLENWSKVSTEDGYTGYIENEDISEAESVALSYVGDMPEYTSIQKDYKINLVWHQVTSMSANDSLEVMLAGSEGLNTISPTWFSVMDNDGNISSLASASYVEKAHALGLEVWGLIDNFSDQADTLTFLSSTKARTNIISQLMEQAKAVGLDGINLDFESITESQGPHYVQFIRELSIACRLNGLVFSIDNPVPMSYNQHYDLEEQGIVADYVIIMGYDEHYAGSTEAGSVASIGFVEKGIVDTLEDVPSEKVINGIPFYTRLWIESYGGNVTSEVFGMDGASNYIKQNGMDTYWDTEVGQTVASLEGSSALYTIWVEDEQSIAEKMKLIKEYDLAGVAAWKLGFERDSVWSVISQYLQ